MTFDELITHCVYLHPMRTHEQREVTGKFRVRAIDCDVSLVPGVGVVVEPEVDSMVCIEVVFYFPLDSRGKRACEKHQECRWDEFAAWIEGK